MPSKNIGGRPRKYKTDEEARQADIKSRQRRRLHTQHTRPVDFIAFEPPLHSNIPANTRPEIGLRISSDIQIPLGCDTQQTSAEQNDPDQNWQPHLIHTAREFADKEEEDKILEEVRRIQAKELEDNVEQAEYDEEVAEAARALQILQAAPILSEAAAPQASGIEERSREDNLQRFDLGDSVNWRFDSTPPPLQTNKPPSIQSSQAGHTPVKTSSPLSVSRSHRSTSRRSTSFPVQRNTLMSWVKPQTTNTPLLPVSPALPSIDLSPPLRPLDSPVSIAASVSTPHEATPHEAPAATEAAVPIRGPTDLASSPVPAERTALKLAKQLRKFQGCTHEQHNDADQLHQEHHQRADVHSECSSIQQITSLLRGNDNGGTPLPDVLSNPKWMKATDFRGTNCQAAFEGTSPLAAPEDSETPNKKLPRNLCLSQHHTKSRKNRQPKVTYDIDSTCCFPTSLAVARHGIHYFPKAHSILNLNTDIHFGLKVSGLTSRGAPSKRYAPLHKIPHYCFGTLIGMEEMLLFIFFPALHAESDYEHTTYLSKQDQQLWFDNVLNPAINKTIGSSNILEHYPATLRIAEIDSTATSAEGLAKKQSAREQLLRHAVQPQYLDSLWSLVLATVEEDPRFHRFKGATLFMHSKNTKLESMVPELTDMYDSWKQRWSEVTDPQFYNPDRTYVDLAKQTTSEDSALPGDPIHEDHEAEVFLWKKCCMDAYSQTRIIPNADGSRAKGNPKRTTYPWATMRDAMGQTFFAAPQGKETRDGLIYSQFYTLVKTPFDSTKVYVFDNESVENLALDPGYVRSLHQEGGSITFSKAVCEFAYLHSKQRAYANLIDNQQKSYGVREEHRISLTMMEEIYQQWRQWDLYDANDPADASSPLPYYIVPTRELLAFLYAQINKYCFLFEHILAHAAKTYSLPETIVMVIALRALRFCYSSSIIGRESLLYKDRWEQARGPKMVVKEGLGMHETMKRCGIGWFLPKFNWATWRLAAPHGENILVGNMLMHEEYKRRWRAVKDLRDVYIRFNQAESWYDQYDLHSNHQLLDVWLEYLHVLNLEQFDVDVWKALFKADKRCSELRREAIQTIAEHRFCYRDMKELFLSNGNISPPHLVTGNKMRFDKVMDLLYFLFLWDDGEERCGWGNKPYRTILQKTFELIERRLGYRKADKWLDEFFHLVRLTHWILPYPSNGAFITTTKSSRSQGLVGRTMWFSVVFANPSLVELPFQTSPPTLFNILWRARRQTFGNGRDQQAWTTSQLITACRSQGLEVDEQVEYWVAGKRSIGLKGFAPVWEQGRPPQLLMLEQIRNKTLDELDDLMVGFSQQHAADNQEDDTEGVEELRSTTSAADSQVTSVLSDQRSLSASPEEAYNRMDSEDEGKYSNSVSFDSGSIFVPSI